MIIIEGKIVLAASSVVNVSNYSRTTPAKFSNDDLTFLVAST